MFSDFEGTPQGATREGIEKLAWSSSRDIPELLKNSYENIKLLLFERENNKLLIYNLGVTVY
jgi:hypothetical protein